MRSSLTRRCSSLSMLVSTVLAAADALAARPSAAQICQDRCSISIAATTDQPSFRVGEPLIFAITVQNTGIVALEGAQVSTIVERTSDKRADTPACGVENRTWSQTTPGGELWSRGLGTLAPGERRTLRFCVVVEDRPFSCATALSFGNRITIFYEFRM